MSAKDDMRIPLEPETYYHIYNRGINGQKIFFEEKNFPYFLQKLKNYIVGYCEVYGYALIPNHFHLAIKTNSSAEIFSSAKNDFQKVPKLFLEKFEPSKITPDLLNFQNLVNLTQEEYRIHFRKETLPHFRKKLVNWIISERFRRFFLAYAKAINRQEERTGSLFQKLFRRKPILNEQHLKQLILYIHRNPIHHNISYDMSDTRWISYHSFLSSGETALQRDEVLKLFGGKADFIKIHEEFLDKWLDEMLWNIED